MIPTFWRETKEQAVKGRPRFFETPEELADACTKYFEWCENNFIEEEVLVSYKGVTTKETKAHPKALLIGSMCVFIGVDEKTWRGWRTTRPDLLPSIQWAEKVIYDQKFTGASGGLLNANIIARELGLADKSELTGKDGGPIQTTTIDPEKLSTSALKEILAARDNAQSDDS